MNLFQRTGVALTWDDVQEFCAQREAEGATLDYKRDVPKDLARVVAAMANTLGGVIVIGVAEDQEAKPIVPAEGMDMTRGLVERVMSICIDNIYPPIEPDMELCPNLSKNKAFVVVRVPQSPQAPHAIGKNTQVYVRSGSISDPDVLATLDRIEWMLERRSKLDDFSDWLFRRASARYADMQAGKVVGVAASREEKAGFGLLTLSLSPTYPNPEPFLRTPDMEPIRHQIRVPDPMGTDHQFPIQGNGTINRTVEDGYAMHWPGGGGLRTYHTHLNIHGLYFYRQSLPFVRPQTREQKEDGLRAPPPAMRLLEIVDRAFCLIGSANKFYQLIGYRGPLTARLELENIGQLPMLVANLATQSGSQLTYEHHSADPTVRARTNTNTRTLVADRPAIVAQLVQRVAWAFDWDVNLTMLEGYASWRRPLV